MFHNQPLKKNKNKPKRSLSELCNCFCDDKNSVRNTASKQELCQLKNQSKTGVKRWFVLFRNQQILT